MNTQRPYLKVPSDEEDSAQTCTRCEHTSRLKLLLIVELVHIAVALVVLAAYFWFQGQSSSDGLDNYWKLQTYNVSAKSRIRNAADPSQHAHKFWMDIQDTNGFVQIENQWAERMKLPTTRQHPNNSDLMIYQIDFFHSIHCLYRIRNRLISTLPLDQWPRNDAHTLHCIDHIRQSLMCHPDLSLQGTSDYVVYENKWENRKCKDMDAIQQWAQVHAWNGYKEYWEKFNWAEIDQMIELDLKEHPGIRWDQFKDHYDPQLPHGFWLEYLVD